jgi:hypothetical protein
MLVGRRFIDSSRDDGILRPEEPCLTCKALASQRC